MGNDKFEQWAILDEVWKPIVGYEGIYDVSSLGRIRRMGKAARNGKGRGGGARIGLILKPQPHKGGYLSIQLWKEGKDKTFLIHCLVAQAFLGPVPDGFEVNHKHGVKTDNRFSELEYVTHSENNLHSYRELNRKVADLPKGELHHNAKLTAENVAEIRSTYQRRKPGFGLTDLAKRFGVDHSTIRRIIIGETWKEVF